MEVLAVDVAYLRLLAGRPKYNWMKSLAPLRTELRQANPASCCPNSRLTVRPVSSSTILQLSRDERLLNDLRALKVKLGVDKMIVSVGSLRVSL